MSVHVFVLGRPGSGKTTAVFHLLELAEKMKYIPARVKDYDILFQMFKEDKDGNFRGTEHGGFDVLNLTMFDVALKLLEENVRSLIVDNNTFITIEFARNDYEEVLKKFSTGFLKDAYIVFVDADIDTCSERIHKRVTDPPKPDFHFVSDYILQTYYSKDNWDYMTYHLRNNCGVCNGVFTIRNSGTKEEFLKAITSIAKTIFEREEMLRTLEKSKEQSYALS